MPYHCIIRAPASQHWVMANRPKLVTLCLRRSSQGNPKTKDRDRTGNLKTLAPEVEKTTNYQLQEANCFAFLNHTSYLEDGNNENDNWVVVRLNKTMQIKYLAQCPAQSKIYVSINGGYWDLGTLWMCYGEPLKLNAKCSVDVHFIFPGERIYCPSIRF